MKYKVTYIVNGREQTKTVEADYFSEEGDFVSFKQDRGSGNSRFLTVYAVARHVVVSIEETD